MAITQDVQRLVTLHTWSSLQSVSSFALFRSAVWFCGNRQMRFGNRQMRLQRQCSVPLGAIENDIFIFLVSLADFRWLRILMCARDLAIPMFTCSCALFSSASYCNRFLKLAAFSNDSERLPQRCRELLGRRCDISIAMVASRERGPDACMGLARSAAETLFGCASVHL